jgi:hypothetical protein
LNRTLVPHTLNCRLKELLQYKLIEHRFEKDKREEWYEITEKRGKKYFSY